MKKIYKCKYITDKIKIDGLLDEPVWNKAEKLNFILPVSHKEPISKTEGKLLYDDKYLYVSFKAFDKDIWSYYKRRDDPTYQEDVLEIFFKTDIKKEPYYNFEINALNTVYDAFNIKREAGGPGHHRWKLWNCNNLKSAVYIKGTLNNYKDIDEYWQLEVAIPFSDLPTLSGRAPKSGDKWLFHLARYDYSIYLPGGVELSSCAALSKVDFHRSEDWIFLEFCK